MRIALNVEKVWERAQNAEKVHTMLRKSEKVCCKLGKKCAKSFTPK